MEQKYLTINSGQVLYRLSKTEGPAVMLIHGFGEDGDIWENQAASLSEKFRLIIPDIPGSGGSDFIEAGKTESALDKYAVILKKILDHENISRCAIIGHSMGGYITLSFLRMFEDCVNGIGFVHSTLFADNTERKEMRKKGISFIEKFGAHSFLKQSIPNLFGDNYAKANPGMIEKLIDKSGNFKPESLIQYYQAMMDRPDGAALIENYRKPVLFIIGEEDKSVSLQDSLKQSHIPSVSCIKILPGVAHMGMWEAKDQVTRFLDDYLNYVIDGC